MAIPSSGVIGIIDIKNEFGGTAPHELSEYYGVDDGVPSSGVLAISDFYGAAASTTKRTNVYSPDIGEGFDFSADSWSNLSNIDGTYNGANTDYAWNSDQGTGFARYIELPFKPTLSGYTIPTGSTIEEIYFYFLGAADSASSLTYRAEASMYYVDTLNGSTLLDPNVRFYADSNGPYPIARSESFTPADLGISDSSFISNWNADNVRMHIAGSSAASSFAKDPVGIRAYQAYCDITYS